MGFQAELRMLSIADGAKKDPLSLSIGDEFDTWWTSDPDDPAAGWTFWVKILGVTKENIYLAEVNFRAQGSPVEKLTPGRTLVLYQGKYLIATCRIL